MKKYFITGLITLMPIFLTIAIFIFLFDLFTAPFLSLIESGLLKLQPTKTFSPILITIIARVIAFILICVFVFMLGLVARWFFISSLINWTNKILSKIPFVKTIYKVTKDISEAFANRKEKKLFTNPAMVNFPSPFSYAVGFQTGSVPSECQKHVDKTLTPVFVPTAPHPISGYLVFVDEEKLKRIEMTNEEAIKFTVSCGIITPENIDEYKDISKIRS